MLFLLGLMEMINSFMKLRLKVLFFVTVEKIRLLGAFESM